MTEDLAKKLNTAGAFDTPWLKEQLHNWNAQEEQKKADFMEHMYQCSGRQDPGHPMHGLYTGLWINFCLTEAGAFARNEYFARLKAVEEFKKQMEKESEETTSIT
jgi:hypothetical protein